MKNYEHQFVPHLNKNRLFGFYGNLCGSVAAFLIMQAEKYGDWYEMEMDEDEGK